MPFANGNRKTWNEKDKEEVWVKQPGVGLEKRQATVVLCIRPKGKQVV